MKYAPVINQKFSLVKLDIRLHVNVGTVGELR